VLILNNDSKKHLAKVKIFNLDRQPKEQVFRELLKINPSSVTRTEFIPSFIAFEVQVVTDSKRVHIWVGGRSGNQNLVGSILVHTDLIRF
jgi:hypothetical protein